MNGFVHKFTNCQNKRSPGYKIRKSPNIDLCCKILNFTLHYINEVRYGPNKKH